MHLVVTGSSGLIGTALVEAALDRGDTVTRLVRSASTVQGPSPRGVTDVPWDPAAGRLDPRDLETTGPVDGVVHLAGAGIGDRRWSAARKEVVRDSRTVATALVARTVAALDPVPPSSSARRPSATTATGATRSWTRTRPRAPGSWPMCAVAWEEATAAAVEAGVRTVRVRTGIVLSRERRRPGPAAAPLPARPRRPDRVRTPVPELDHPRRRGGRAAALPGRRGTGRSGQRHGTGAGHRRRAGPGARGGPAPSGRRARPGLRPQGRPRLRDGHRVGPDRPAGRAHPPGRHRVPLPPSPARRRRARRTGRRRDRRRRHRRTRIRAPDTLAPARIGPRTDRRGSAHGRDRAAGRRGAVDTGGAPGLEAFEAAARSFLDAHADRRPEETYVWGQGSDDVSLFPERTPAQQVADLAASRVWAQTVFDAGFGWITGPTRYGGRGLPGEYQRSGARWPPTTAHPPWRSTASASAWWRRPSWPTPPTR